MKTTIQVGVSIHDGGAAIVTSEHRTDGDVVVGIESLPFDVEAVAGRMGDLADELPQAQFVIDSEGLGTALWEILYPESRVLRDVLASRIRHKDGAPHGWLYQDRGLDRQRLVNVLVIAMYQQALHFAAGLPGMEAMTNALVTYKRQVKEDGLIGAELVVALCLATLPRVVAVRHTASMA